MTNLYEIAGYLANPKRKLLIEVEVADDKVDAFREDYAKLTKNGFLPPAGNPPFHVIPGGNNNKWGAELRTYYLDDNNAPTELASASYDNTRQDKPQYNRRCDQGKNLIKKLFSMGFVLGDNQNLTRIQAKVPASRMAEFMAGYKL